MYFQEEEERKRKEEQERKEHEEYLLLKEHFTVEEEGVGETAEEVSVYTIPTVRETCQHVRWHVVLVVSNGSYKLFCCVVVSGAEQI